MSSFDLADIAGINKEDYADKQFEGELSYVQNECKDFLTVNPQISSLYYSNINSMTHYATTIKSDKSSLKGLNERIEDTERNLSDRYDELRQRANEIREIRRRRSEYQDTMPFSKESKNAKHQLDDMVRRFRQGNAHKRRDKKRLAEMKEHRDEKQAEMKEYSKKLDEAKKYQDTLVAGVRNQIDIALRLKSTYEALKKSIDLNDPSINQAAIIQFTSLFNSKKIEISLTNSISNAEPDLINAYNACLQSMNKDGKKAISDIENKNRKNCKAYAIYKTPDIAKMQSLAQDSVER